MSKYTHINIWITFYDAKSRYVIADLMEGNALRWRSSSNHYKQQRYIDKYIEEFRQKHGYDLPVNLKEDKEYVNKLENAKGPINIFDL